MTVFTQFDEPLRKLWENVSSREPAHWPFFSFSWHEAWYRHFGNGQIIMVMGDETRGVIIPLAITDAIAHFTGGEEIADYLDAVGDTTQKAAAWKSAIPLLKKHGATRLLLRNIPANSPTIEYFKTLPEAVVEVEDTTPVLSLPGLFDEYVNSLDRKDRHELKRKLKKFEAEHPNLSFVPRNRFDVDMASLLGLMRHDTDKTQFLTEPMTNFFENIPTVFPEEVWQFILTQHEGAIIATTLAFRTSDSLLLYNSGFDPHYPGAGWYIKVKTIAWAIEQRIRFYNFLQGNERYKYDLGAKDRQVLRIMLPL